MSMLRLIPAVIISEFIIIVTYVSVTPAVQKTISSLVSAGSGFGLSSLGSWTMTCYHLAFLILSVVPLIYGFWYATRTEYDQYYRY